MNYVYIAKEFGGEYEDYYENILGIFDNLERAKRYCDFLNKSRRKDVDYNYFRDYSGMEIEQHHVQDNSTAVGQSIIYSWLRYKDDKDWRGKAVKI